MKFLLAPSSRIAIDRLNRINRSGDLVFNFFGFDVIYKPRRLFKL